MPSQVWERDSQEAFDNPYEYEIQDQFVREATKLLCLFYALLNSDKYQFTVASESLEKAIWLLSLDALDSLRDCLDALTKKKHRVAGKLFRNVLENMDLVKFFFTKTEKSQSCLRKWYRNEIILHKEFRDFIKIKGGPKESEKLARYYKDLSKFIHRSHLAILDGFIIGDKEKLFHDGYGELVGESENAKLTLVPPQTISYYFSILASLILKFSEDLVNAGLVTEAEKARLFKKIMETKTIPRRFVSRTRIPEEEKCTQ